MFPFVEPSRARLPLRLAAFSLLAAVTAGCSADMSRFERGGGNVFASRGNTPPAAITGSVPRTAHAPIDSRPAQAAPVGRVEMQPLPGGPTASSLPPPPAPRYAAAPPPSHPAQASVTSRPTRATRSSAPSAVHVVSSGETLHGIARRYKKSAGEIARANDIKSNANVRIGQRLTIPGVSPAAVKVAAATPAPVAAPASAPVPRAVPVKPEVAKPAEKKAAIRGAPPANLSHPEPRVERAAVATPAAAPVEAEEAPAPSAAGKPSFRWPVRGRVIAGFGPRPSGQQNDGINLAVPEGTSIRAAEDGVVAYAGNELKGYGNLVLVRHSNGYVTAYAHASEVKVKRGDRVRRGQIIALAGQTGGVASPQLHFEIRRGSTPVDPVQYLASN
jgi:murein DD-endopeptidase MepM/ murein hydrolase activator NlpD